MNFRFGTKMKTVCKSGHCGLWGAELSAARFQDPEQTVILNLPAFFICVRQHPHLTCPGCHCKTELLAFVVINRRVLATFLPPAKA